MEDVSVGCMFGSSDRRCGSDTPGLLKTGLECVLVLCQSHKAPFGFVEPHEDMFPASA